MTNNDDPTVAHDEENVNHGIETEIIDEVTEPIRERRSRTQPRHFAGYDVKLPPSVDHA